MTTPENHELFCTMVETLKDINSKLANIIEVVKPAASQTIYSNQIAFERTPMVTLGTSAQETVNSGVSNVSMVHHENLFEVIKDLVVKMIAEDDSNRAYIKELLATEFNATTIKELKDKPYELDRLYAKLTGW